MLSRSTLSLVTPAAVLALLMVLCAACSEPPKPTAVAIIGVSEGVEVIQQSGATKSAAPSDVLALGTGLTLSIPVDGHVYLLVRETGVVGFIGSEGRWRVDDLLVLEEPPTDRSVKEQLGMLEREKRSPTVWDTRVAAFHQGVQSAVTVGHEERKADDDAPRKDAAKSERQQAAGDAPGAISEVAEAEGEGASPKEASAHKPVKKRAADPQAVPTQPPPIAKPLAGQPSGADGDKAADSAPPMLPRTAETSSPRKVPKRAGSRGVKSGKGSTRGLGLNASGAGYGAGSGRPADNKPTVPMAKAPRFSRAGVVLELDGSAALTKRVAPVLKAAHAAVLKCAAVKQLKDGDALVVTIKRGRGKASVRGGTACVRKALSAVRAKVPAAGQLRVTIRSAPAGR